MERTGTDFTSSISGLIYRAMGTLNVSMISYWRLKHCTGFPLDFFPVLFAVPRVVGWLAHWRQVSGFARTLNNPLIILL